MCQGVGASVSWVSGHSGPACDSAGVDQSNKNHNKKERSKDATLFTLGTEGCHQGRLCRLIQCDDGSKRAERGLYLLYAMRVLPMFLGLS